MEQIFPGGLPKSYKEVQLFFNSGENQQLPKRQLKMKSFAGQDKRMYLPIELQRDRLYFLSLGKITTGI